MKKILLLFLFGIALIQGVYSQEWGKKKPPRTERPTTEFAHFLSGLSVTSNERLGVSILANFQIFDKKKIGVFVGVDGLLNQKRCLCPSLEGERFQYAAIGLGYTSKKFWIGTGPEQQEVQIRRNDYFIIDQFFAWRVFIGFGTKRQVATASFNIGGKGFHYAGYWHYYLEDRITAVGIFANSATIGVGPSIRWGEFKDIMQYGASVGFNPYSKQFGIAAMMMID